MTKLHQLLAAEATVVSAYNTLLDETRNKFSKASNYFEGHTKTLQMVQETAENTALEQSSREDKDLPTTVPETLDYLLTFWAKAEDLLFQKNNANRFAVANLIFRGKVIAAEVPVDELMGLEGRLTKLRGLMQEMPTHDASKTWVPDDSAVSGTYKMKDPVVTTKTEKMISSVTLSPATDKHPAQVKEISKDVVVGTWTLNRRTGTAKTLSKAAMLAVIDELIIACKQARTRANDVEVPQVSLGEAVKGVLMGVF